MNRTYLFVPPEEKSEVEALGAQWDTITKRWYVGWRTSTIHPASPVSPEAGMKTTGNTVGLADV
jgi:uncharacterized protein DUF5710